MSLVPPVHLFDLICFFTKLPIRLSEEKQGLESNSDGRGEDRISALPDTVLSHILSLIPSTKQHVRTSVLSTRWKNIWASVPKLYFNDDEFSTSADFISFVDCVLGTRESVDIQKLHLHFNSCHAEDYSRIDGWISTAVRCNVVELDLSVDFKRGGEMCHEDYEVLNEEDEILHEEFVILPKKDELYVLPLSLLICKTLKVLSLRSMFIINIPTSGYCCFPSLKFLHLHFTANSCRKFKFDLFSFPVLGFLSMDRDHGFRELNFSISAPELKTLKIDLCSAGDVQGLYTFFIDVPKVDKLELRMGSLANFKFKNTDALVEASIQLFTHYNEDYVTDYSINHATEFLAQLSKVKYLSLKWGIHQACSIPAFDTLSKLTFTHFGKSYWTKNLMKLLERSPNLECLEIDDGFYPTWRQVELEEIRRMEAKARTHKNNAKEVTSTKGAVVINLSALARKLNWVPPESVPTCLSMHLKTISFKGFMGKGLPGYLDQIELAKYLLNNCQVLEKMTIYTPGLRKGTQEDICREISMFEWGSKALHVKMIKKMFIVS